MAEGARLLSGYGGLTSIEGSNPSVSVAGRTPLRIAHRGYRDGPPENSLAAIERALALGADAIEIDVRRRRDGRLVLDHDTGRRVAAPLLDDALALIAGAGRIANLDLKERSLAGSVIESVERTGAHDLVVCTGGVWPTLRELSRTGIRTGLTLPRRRLPLPRRARDVIAPSVRRRLAASVERFAAGDDTLFSLHHELVDERVVERVHALGLALWVWTVDDPAVLERLRALGVDGICSDFPSSHELGPDQRSISTAIS